MYQWYTGAKLCSCIQRVMPDLLTILVTMFQVAM